MAKVETSRLGFEEVRIFGLQLSFLALPADRPIESIVEKARMLIDAWRIEEPKVYRPALYVLPRSSESPGVHFVHVLGMTSLCEHDVTFHSVHDQMMALAGRLHTELQPEAVTFLHASGLTTPLTFREIDAPKRPDEEGAGNDQTKPAS